MARSIPEGVRKSESPVLFTLALSSAVGSPLVVAMLATLPRAHRLSPDGFWLAFACAAAMMAGTAFLVGVHSLLLGREQA